MRWAARGALRWLEADLPGSRAIFTTRGGGASPGEYESLNLGAGTGDERDRVLENRRRLGRALGFAPESVLSGRQVHGAEVLHHGAGQDPPPWCLSALDPPEADGHATASADLIPLVLVADCLPIALAGPGGIAMLHGGWRGLAAGIIEHGVRAVGAEAAAIGPGIGPCCYEVGDEVLAAFAPLGAGLAVGRMLDLKAVARRLLERAGVGSVEDAATCTCCTPDLFFSHRCAGPRTGRQAGLVIRVPA